MSKRQVHCSMYAFSTLASCVIVKKKRRQVESNRKVLTRCPAESSRHVAMSFVARQVDGASRAHHRDQSVAFHIRTCIHATEIHVTSPARHHSVWRYFGLHSTPSECSMPPAPSRSSCQSLLPAHQEQPRNKTRSDGRGSAIRSIGHMSLRLE